MSFKKIHNFIQTKLVLKLNHFLLMFFLGLTYFVFMAPLALWFKLKNLFRARTSQWKEIETEIIKN